jgi:hypothetical protein
LDPDTDTDFFKNVWKIEDKTLEREKNLCVSIGKFHPLTYRLQITYEMNERLHLEKFRAKILIQAYPNPKKIGDPNPKKIISDPQHC